MAGSLRAKVESFEANVTEPLPLIPAGAYVEDVSRLLSEVERLRGGLRAILREHGPEIEPGRGDRCGICSPQDKHYPCVTVQEARAALEEGV